MRVTGRATYEDIATPIPDLVDQPARDHAPRISIRKTLGHQSHWDGPFRTCWFCRRIVERIVDETIADMTRRGAVRLD